MRLVYALLIVLLAMIPARAFAETGTARVFHMDLLDGSSVWETDVEPDTGPTFKVHKGPLPYKGLKEGDRVWFTRAKGKAPVVMPLEAAPLQASVRGSFPTLILGLTFTNNRSEPVTMAQVLAGSLPAEGFFQALSYGTVSLLPMDAHGWVPLDVPDTNCRTNLIAWAAQAKAKAAAQGVPVSSYLRVVYVFNTAKSCGFSGAASGADAFINGPFALSALNHELGHTFGLAHSHSIHCGTTPFTLPCAKREYGDITDTMGGAFRGHFNPFQKLILGWLDTPGMPALTTVTQSGTYTIHAYDELMPASAGPKGLRIPRGGTQHYWYVRLSRGGFVTPYEAFRGLFLYEGYEPSKHTSYLIDLTPTVPLGGDQGFAVGQTFVDPGTVPQITIRADSIGADTATLTVTMGAAPPPPPPPPPPGEQDVTLSFNFTEADKVRVNTYAVPVPPYTCQRVTGGSAQWRILKDGVVKKAVGANNITGPFTLRCQVTATVVNLYHNGVLKATVPK